MPVDFENNFIKPFLKDLEIGAITDADTFCSKLSEYYENTILQGQPIGVPAALLSPALTSAALGVPTNGIISTQQDNYIRPNSSTSQQKMYNTLSKYYVTRELLLAEQDLKTSIDTLDTIIRKQQFNIKRIEALTKKALLISKQIKELPNKIKDFANLADAILNEYRQDLKQIKETYDKKEVKVDIDLQEIEIINVVTSLDFSNIRSVTQSLLKMTRYLSDQYLRQKQFNKTTFIVERLKDLAQAIVTPESFGILIARLSSDKSDIQSLIDRAKQSYRDIKVIQTELKPLLQIVERKIKEIKESLANRITTLIEDEKKNIQKKQAEKQLKKKPRHKFNLLKQAKEDLKNFRKENEEEFKKIRKKQKTITKIATKSNNILQQVTAISSNITIVEIPFLKEKIETTYANISGSLSTAVSEVSQSRSNISIIKAQGSDGDNKKADREIRQYFTRQQIGDFVEPFALLANESKLTYQDFRVLIEQRDQRYGIYKTQLKAIKTQFYEIRELAQTLDDDKVTFRYPRESEEDRRDRAIQKEVDRKVREARRQRRNSSRLSARPVQSLVSILKAIARIAQRIRGWTNSQIKKFKTYVKKQSEKVKKLQEKIKNALIDLVPLRTADADKLTKEQARKEKLNRINEYKAKLQLVRDKTAAITQVSIAGGAITVNMASGKYSAKDNEAHLRKIAEGRYKFETVGLDPDPTNSTDRAAYAAADLNRKKFLETIDILNVLDPYVALTITTIQAIKNKEAAEFFTSTGERATELGRGFIEDLKQAAAQTYENVAGQQASGDIGIVKNLKSDRFISLIVDFYTAEPSFNSILTVLRKLRLELKGELMTSLLKSANLTQALVDLESKYLFKVQVQIRKAIGYMSEQNNLDEETDGQSAEAVTALGRKRADIRKFTQEKKAAARKQTLGKYNIYEELVRLDKLISKRQGSFLAAMMNRLMILLSEFEETIRKQVKEFLDDAKKKLVALGRKYYVEHQESLDRIKDKLLNAEARVLSALLGLSTRLFWTGATWQNNVGTTFQVLSIGRFPQLKRNGFVDGGEQYIREIAANFEQQLTGMKGIVYPNPAYSIPPFSFSGYGPITPIPLTGGV